jgi:hypothetical protein
MLIMLYAKKAENGAVDIFKSPNGELYATFPSWHSGKPDKRFKYLTLNCYRWRLEWI